MKQSSTLKRGDAFAKTKQYKEAKSDYQKVEQTQAIKSKVNDVDKQIKLNEKTIQHLGNSYTGISTADKFKLGTAFLENGNRVKAEQTFKTIDLSKLQPADINKIDPKTIVVLKENPTYKVIKPTLTNKYPTIKVD